MYARDLDFYVTVLGMLVGCFFLGYAVHGWLTGV